MLPEAFTKRMKTLLAEEYGAFLDSFSRPRAVALRLNPLKTQAPPDLSGFSLRPVPWEPCGFYYDPETRPGKSAYHEAGLYYLQEASAMAPAALLDPQPGERVLDLCAAPGGKSTQLAGMRLHWVLLPAVGHSSNRSGWLLLLFRQYLALSVWSYRKWQRQYARSPSFSPYREARIAAMRGLLPG